MTLTEKFQDIIRQIDQLEQAKSDLIQQMIEVTGHNKVGSATYELDGRKVLIKTDETYRLDKERLNLEWNPDLPFNRSYAYTIRKKDYDASMTHGNPALRKLLSEIVTTAPAKPYVKIGD